MKAVFELDRGKKVRGIIIFSRKGRRDQARNLNCSSAGKEGKHPRLAGQERGGKENGTLWSPRRKRKVVWFF